MKRSKNHLPASLLILWAGAMIWCSSFTTPQNRTERKETAFTTTLKDTIPVRVDLVYSETNLPDHYYSRIKTPVCEDSLCYLITIDLRWDLLGNFLSYETPEGSPLTKFDHVEFTPSDHARMKAILSDKESALRDYRVENLIEAGVQKKSAVVADAVSGATNTAIRDEVVEGALYSTYTIWHIVNGAVAGKIRQHTESFFSEAILTKMLASDNEYYQYYALNRIPEKDLDNYADAIIRLISQGSSYVPYFAIEKVTSRIWAKDRYQEKLVRLIGKVPFKMQNELLNKIKDVRLGSGTLDMLVSYLNVLDQNQQKKVHSIIALNRQALSETALSIISKFSENPKP